MQLLTLTRLIVVGALMLFGMVRSARADDITIYNITFSPPTIAAGGELCSVSASVTAKYGLSRIALRLTDATGSYSESVMSASNGKDFEGSILAGPNRSNTQPGVTLALVVTDAHGTVKTKLLTKQATDKTPPKVSAVLLNPKVIPVAGGDVTVQATVTDSQLPVASVKLRVTDAKGTYSETPMTTSDGNMFVGTALVSMNTSNSSPGSTISLYAVDAAGNSVWSVVGKQGFDKTSPRISSVVVSPRIIPIAGGNVAVQATVTDSQLPLSGVFLRITDAKGNYTLATMTSTDGKTYTGSGVVSINTSNATVGTTIVVTGTDAAGNVVSNVVATQGYDNVAPVVSVRIAPVPSVAGGSYTYVCTVKDNALPLTVVRLRCTDANGNYGEVSMSTTDGRTYSGTITVPANDVKGRAGAIIYIRAIDAASNATPYIQVAQQPIG